MTLERIQCLKDVIKYRQNDLTLVLENIWDPHNVGAILRSADSVGILEVSLVYTTEEFPRMGKRTSAGTRKWIGLNTFSSISECYADLRTKGFQIFATHLDETPQDLYSLDLTGKVAIVFGNESRGVSDEAFEKADGNFVIPQIGFAKSLNVSVAAAVTLFEALRQRSSHLEKLSKAEQAKLFKKWKEL